MDFLFCYTMVVYGLANMLVYFNGPFGLIDKFRTWIGNKHSTFEELFSCMFCMPTNIGIILSIISLCIGLPFTPFTLFYGNGCVLLSILFDGLYAGATCYLIHTIQNRIELKDGD